MAWFYFEILCYVIWFILILTSIFLTVFATSHNQQIWLQKRNALLFHTINISTIITICSFLFFAICCVHMSQFLIALSTVVWVLSVFIWICLLVIKNWMIYYQYKWTFYIINRKWQQIINPNVLDEPLYAVSNWFIANHETYGQLNYVYKLFASAAIICILTGATAWFILPLFNVDLLHHTIFSFIVNIGLYIPWVSLYAFCVWNIPALDDAFYIHFESQIHAKLLCLTVPNPVLCGIYILIWGDIRAFFVTCFTGSIILFGMLFVSTAYIPKQIQLKQQIEHKLEDDVTLQMVLSNEQSMNLFMHHLASEYVHLIQEYVSINEHVQMTVVYKQCTGTAWRYCCHALKLCNFKII